MDNEVLQMKKWGETGYVYIPNQEKDQRLNANPKSEGTKNDNKFTFTPHSVPYISSLTVTCEGSNIVRTDTKIVTAVDATCTLIKISKLNTKTPITYIYTQGIPSLIIGTSLMYSLKGHCHAIWQLYKRLECIFASIEFQN